MGVALLRNRSSLSISEGIALGRVSIRFATLRQAQGSARPPGLDTAGLDTPLRGYSTTSDYPTTSDYSTIDGSQ